MKETPTSVKELSHMISENKSEVLNALRGLQDKMDKEAMKTLVDELTK
jgi:hypothetical protein